ncbi:hypothetical protein Glove_130g187 [Diversispora epigaea]|uniref:Uncharacterized protein n=1 Tax=Diversispora epigaea TaxID=1348612 RepID=A0A397J2I4_9GLOM|nr:hypothetical protein Glove_130g187 [Diversispora epigaea]
MDSSEKDEIDFISVKLASKSNPHNSEEGKREERDESSGGGGRDAIVFNTYQIYLKDSFLRLRRLHDGMIPTQNTDILVHTPYNGAVGFLLNELYKNNILSFFIASQIKNQ